jgi:hypothetical protein
LIVLNRNARHPWRSKLRDRSDERRGAYKATQRIFNNPLFIDLPMNIHLLLAGVAVLFTACASNSDQSPQQAMSAPARCTSETPIGSSIPTVRCRTAEQMERDRMEAQKMDSTLRAATPRRPGE